MTALPPTINKIIMTLDTAPPPTEKYNHTMTVAQHHLLP